MCSTLCRESNLGADEPDIYRAPSWGGLGSAGFDELEIPSQLLRTELEMGETACLEHRVSTPLLESLHQPELRTRRWRQE